MRPSVFFNFLYMIIIILVIHNISSCRPEEELPIVYGSVDGTVYNSFEQLLDNVEIKIIGNGLEKLVRTSENGRFMFQDIPVGSYSLSVTKESFISSVRVVNLVDDSRVTQDFILEAGDAYFEVSKNSLSVGYTAGSNSVTVMSNTTWVVESDEDWIETSSIGEGDGSFEIHWQENKGLETRLAVIRVSVGELMREINITQSAKVRLIEYRGIPGNSFDDEFGSIVLIFNKPVEVNVNPLWELCSSAVQIEYFNENKEVRFLYACGKLGGKYPFRLNITDSDDVNVTETIEVGFYSKELEVQGSIIDYYVDDVRNSYWIVSYWPNRIYQISMDDLSILSEKNLNFRPTILALNNYTNEVYIGEHLQSKLHVLDINSLNLERTLNILPDKYNETTEYNTIPYDIEFTTNGQGIVLLEGGSSRLVWRMIDSRDNDRMYVHQYYDIWNDTHFSKVYKNHDGSRLFLNYIYTQSADSPKITIFDQDSETFSEYWPPEESRSARNFLMPNRKNDLLYVGQLYKQLIVNPITNYASQISGIDTRFDPSADFSYKQGEEEIIYYCDQKRIEVLDYSIRDSPYYYDAIFGLRGLTSTLDGEKVMVYKAGQNYKEGTTEICSYLYQFSTSLFSKD
ncbi:MAG: hypothetical protein COW03_07035 [Cytophagales bacterium CG12_big_fil_rev_8_21_14_0_65_40_12]|nr:MAG: hypothetical protein COW03_07035 [Cytophagales bacterium CG12_big_fil_rev_8_21_14_0_65_40_12]PIW02867.1 MAG: hypothetical protein COW40_17955 [Cytophagales bacterium CG17_big_fil_post_rev_8_21_14_2_50_40_13]